MRRALKARRESLRQSEGVATSVHPFRVQNETRCTRSRGRRAARLPLATISTPPRWLRSAACHLVLQFSIDGAHWLAVPTCICSAAVRQHFSLSQISTMAPSSHDKLKSVGPVPGSYRFEDGRAPTWLPRRQNVTAMPKAEDVGLNW